jgi:hypothetical protein
MSFAQGETCCTYTGKTKQNPGVPGPCAGGNPGPVGTLAAAIAHAGNYTVPWWGEKWTSNLKNAGYVIGFKDATNNNRHWHLDWDPGKGLHINWEDKTKVPAQKVYHKVSDLNIAFPQLSVVVNGQAVALPDSNSSAEANQHKIWIAWSRAALTAGQVPTTAEKKTICKARLGQHDDALWPTIVDIVNDDEHPWLTG